MIKFQPGDRVVVLDHPDNDGVQRNYVGHVGRVKDCDDLPFVVFVGGDVVCFDQDKLALYPTSEALRMKVYIIGSLRNPEAAVLAQQLRKDFPSVEVFDDWVAAGPEADDYWRDYEKAKGNDLQAALKGHAARHVFEYDKGHLDTSDVVILALPAGKSGHLELGYSIGKGKKSAILLDNQPDRFDVMYGFADLVTDNYAQLKGWLQEVL